MEIVINDSEVSELRKHYKDTFFSTRYSGWRDDFDSQFDFHSKWYAAKGRNVYCRVTYRSNKNPIPIDYAGFFIPKVKGVCVEINNFNYPRELSDDAILLIEKILKSLQSEGVSTVYCVVDELRRFAYKLNTEKFGFKDLKQSRTFEGIDHSISGISVNWLLLARELNA